MKLRIIENGSKFMIQRRRWWVGWQVLTARIHWHWRIESIDDWEFFHHKFETLQDAESFVNKLKTKGREAWVAFRPEDAKVVKEYR